ncbi:MAG: winged helix-turn-helix transcriptional regulator [Deltaproteobacteria bacterium]|nr:winged helix-turn-helix transcriptional regulator [Deltaproteobacteria bacterium]
MPPRHVTPRFDSQRLDATFTALADPTRRAILARLADGDASVTELAAPFDMSQPAISKHLKVLERAGLVTRSQDAQRRPCHLEPVPLREAEDWLQRFADRAEQRFAAMDAVLAELVARRAPPSGATPSSPKNKQRKKESRHERKK